MPSLADILRPSMQTLKHILVHIYDVGVDSDPLLGIPSELEDMRNNNNNTIETIEISITDVNRFRDLEGNWGVVDWRVVDWGRLDQVLTALGWFSLKRVSLSMRIHRDTLIVTDPEPDVILRNLIRRQFPRLSSSNSVSFDLKVNDVHE